ncbi:ATP-NAD kinase family protein [uncultured Psychrosphaera sp.]|uniref:ATP-NAD kinase family protein n=1 Tax=uncultured Psychrosphaera sp. TaxID=1403522 RepID=UPI0030F730FE
MPDNKSVNTNINQQSRVNFRLGLIINPIAGVGGSVGLKGSDGDNTAELAKSLGAEQKANDRASIALSMLSEYIEHVDIFTVAGEMGQSLCEQLQFAHNVVYTPTSAVTTHQDTENAAKVLADLKVDLILFVGGDGTARNICAAVEDNVTVLGVPAGCKIHSGVYAITPKAAGRVLQLLVTGELVTVSDADVMDIDEEKFRQGIVKARRYGELSVPSELRFIQNVKMGGKESDELVLNDIAAHVIELMEPEQTYIMGSGSTVAYLMEELSLPNTLLGVDVIQDHNLLKQDVTASELLTFIDDNTKLVITLIGGQGHIFGRGNQQLSPEVIKRIGKDNILVIATKTKLKALNGRPLIVDTGDVSLDKSLSGHIKVITGYHDQVLYPVGYEEL